MVDGLDIGLGIMVIGLIIGLPNLNSFFIDFTQFSTSAITVMRLGLTAIFVWLLAGGRG